MVRAAVLAMGLLTCGCAVANDPDRVVFGATLAPLCIFNCVITVTYAPGVERLAKSEGGDRRPRLGGEP